MKGAEDLRPRVLHLVSHPIQYFIPLYRDLASRKGLDLTVCFYSDRGVSELTDPGFGVKFAWDVPLLNGYRHRFLNRWSKRESRFGPSLIRNPRLLFEIASHRYDAIWIHGYTFVTVWILVLLARFRRIPVLVRDDATLLDRKAGWRRVAKAIVLPLLFRLTYALCIGQRNREFFERYQRRDRIFFAPYSVDNGFFREAEASFRQSRLELRRELGIGASVPVILFCGKLIQKKDPITLLRAYARVRAAASCALIVVGDGPLRNEIIRLIANEKIPDVHLLGFFNQSQIGRAYAAADVLTLPSVERETWGLVVNEAMNYALPIVVSDKVGSGPDLVFPGRNGAVFPSGSVAALEEVLRDLVSNETRRQEFGRASRLIVDSWGIEQAGDCIVQAIDCVSRRVGTAGGGMLPFRQE